jgi:hypothetical protein
VHAASEMAILTLLQQELIIQGLNNDTVTKMCLHLKLHMKLATLPKELKHKQTTADNSLLIQAFTNLPTTTASYPIRIGLSSKPLCKPQMSPINKMQENELPNSGNKNACQRNARVFC